MKYYEIEKILTDFPDCQYYLVIGERSNGKTYSTLRHALKKNVETGEQFAYVRRWGEDIRKKEMTQLFSAHVENGEVIRLTKGRWDNVIVVGGRFYFSRLVQEEKKEGKIVDKIEQSEEPIGFAFDLNSMEHYKSISYPKITTVIFDEFLSRNGYLPNEFILFTNTLSTIIRQRNNVTVFMLGNTVNQYCPYFKEMGLTHIKDQKQGTVDIYNYGTSGLKVAVEYCESTKRSGGKKSDVYFAFDNPELQMITEGSWEIAIYPHKPARFAPKDIAFIFFIEFENDIVQGEFVSLDSGPFIFFHMKTGPIKNPDSDIVYTTRPNEKWNYKACITKHDDQMSRIICKFIRENRCFYATNEVGEIVRNYLMWSNNYSILN